MVLGKDRELKGHKGHVTSLSWSLDGRHLASSSTDSTIRLWKEYTANHELKGHQGTVDQVLWSRRDDNLLVSTATDKTVKLWDINQVGSYTNLRTFETGGLNLSWDHSNLLAVGTKDDLVTILDITSGKTIWSKKFKCEINQMAWHNGSLYLTTGLGSIISLDLSLYELKEFYAHTSNCYCITSDGIGTLAVGAADAIVSLWDTVEMASIRTVGRMEWPIRAVAFSSRGDYLAIGSEDSVIDVCRSGTGEQVAKVSVRAAVSSIAWNPSRLMIAYASEEIDPRTNKPLGNIHLVY